MAGSFWWDLVIGVAAALLPVWAVLVVALVAIRPRGELLRVLRPVRRLAADRPLPRGVRTRLWLLMVYLALPIDLVPTSSRCSDTPTTRSS